MRVKVRQEGEEIDMSKLDKEEAAMIRQMLSVPKLINYLQPNETPGCVDNECVLVFKGVLGPIEYPEHQTAYWLCEKCKKYVSAPYKLPSDQ